MDFFLGLDEFVQEKHYWWRRKAFSLATQAGAQAYDLSKPVNQGGAGAADLVEIEELFVVNGAPCANWPLPVHPALASREIVAGLYGNSAVQSEMSRDRYFLSLGTFQQLNLTMAPDQVFTLAGTYWAVPMVTNVASQSSIPLVPPNLHFGLVYMFERRVYELLYGQDDPRFAMADKRYEDFKVTASKSVQFSSQQSIAFATRRPAIQSSGDRGWGWPWRRC